MADLDDDVILAERLQAEVKRRSGNAESGMTFARDQITKLSKWLGELFTPEEVEEIKDSREVQKAERYGDLKGQFMRASQNWNEEVANYTGRLQKATQLLRLAEQKLKTIPTKQTVAEKFVVWQEVDRLATESWSISILADNEMEFAYKRMLVAAVLNKADVSKIARPKAPPVERVVSRQPDGPWAGDSTDQENPDEELEVTQLADPWPSERTDPDKKREATQSADPWAGDWTGPEYNSNEEGEATQPVRTPPSQAATQVVESEVGRSRGAYQRVPTQTTRSPVKTQLAQGTRWQSQTPPAYDEAASEAESKPVSRSNRSRATEKLKQFATQLCATLSTDVKKFVVDTEKFSFDISLDPDQDNINAAVHELSHEANETPYKQAAVAVRNALQEGDRIARSVLDIAEPRSRKGQAWEQFYDRMQSAQSAMRNAITSFNGCHLALENAFKKIVTQKARHIALGELPRFPPRRGSEAARHFQEMHFQVQPDRPLDRVLRESTQRQRAAKAFTSLQKMATDFIRHIQVYEFPENLEPNREDIDAAIDELTLRPDEDPYRQSVEVARNAFADANHIVELAVNLIEPWSDSKLEWERFVDQVRNTRIAFEAAKDQYSVARANLKEQHAKIIKWKALHEAMDWLRMRPPQPEPNFPLSQRKR